MGIARLIKNKLKEFVTIIKAMFEVMYYFLFVMLVPRVVINNNEERDNNHI